MGIFSDYPHFYTLTKEGQTESFLFAMRSSENGEFIISRTNDVFCKYGPNFVAVMKPNILGTKFDVYDFGMDTLTFGKNLPTGFFQK